MNANVSVHDVVRVELTRDAYPGDAVCAPHDKIRLRVWGSDDPYGPCFELVLFGPSGGLNTPIVVEGSLLSEAKRA